MSGGITPLIFTADLQTGSGGKTPLIFTADLQTGSGGIIPLIFTAELQTGSGGITPLIFTADLETGSGGITPLIFTADLQSPLAIPRGHSIGDCVGSRAGVGISRYRKILLALAGNETRFPSSAACGLATTPTTLALLLRTAEEVITYIQIEE